MLRAGDDTVLGDLSRERRTRAAIDLTWNAVAAEVAAATERAPETESAVLPLRARISVRAGLGNLATGLRPPASGHDNPHYFDDAACVRACVLAVAHPGDPRAAADLAEFDARYTQDGDGVHGARAMAAAVSLALAGAGPDACAAAACAELPEDTEIGRNARHALALAADAGSAFALVPSLEHQIVDHVYSYGVAAAETVPVALALTTAAGGRIAEAVPAAACLSRVADSAPALAGALTGALGGSAAIPASWRESCRTLSGCVLPGSPGRTWSNSPRCWKPPNRPHPEDDPGMNYEATEDAENTADTPSLDERITGALVGAAVGDALGGPVEGYSPEQIAERHGGRVHGVVGPWHGADWRTARPIAPYHKGDGHVTDDTLMTHALVRVYATVRDHLDAYAVADHLVPDLMTNPRWIPELEAETIPLHRIFLAEKWLVARLHYGHVDPREAGVGNIVNCGAAMYMAPVGLVNAAHPAAAYAEALDVAGAHQSSYGREAAGVFAAAVAAACAPDATPDSVVAACLPLAKDGTREAVERVCEEASKHTDVESALRPLREAVAPYDTVGPDYRSPRWAPGVRPGCTRSRNSRSPWAWWWRPAATSGTPCWAR